MEVTNPDRLVFPEDGITKGHVVAYYANVTDRLLPYIRRRPLTVERFPRGVGSEGFMQKNAPEHYPTGLIGRHEVPRSDGSVTLYPVVDSAEGIAYLANLNAITFHVPTVTVDADARPDWAIWDLDPPPGRLDLAREAAARMRTLLEELSMPTLLMASGSQGYHLRAPLQPALTAGGAQRLTRGAAVLGAARHGDLLTVAFHKAERGDRVFVDWLRNTPHATTVAPWSLRPRRGAPVAAPLRWEDLWSVEPDQVGLADIEDVTDPWREQPTIDPTPAAGIVDALLAEAGLELEPFDRFRS